MKNVTMLVTSANPERILLEGKTYRLSDEEAAELMAAGAGKDEGPAAKPATPGTKPTKITPPDPGEEQTDNDDGDDSEAE